MKAWIFAACLATATAFVSAPSHADPVTRDVRTVRGPNPDLFVSGALTLGVSYAPAFVVATQSERTEDRLLYAPVAGPWLDLSQRACEDCRREGVNKALLITDGIIQGVGALEIVASFLFLETRVIKAGKQAQGHHAMRLELTPVRMAGGYGVRASGRF